MEALPRLFLPPDTQLAHPLLATHVNCAPFLSERIVAFPVVQACRVSPFGLVGFVSRINIALVFAGSLRRVLRRSVQKSSRGVAEDPDLRRGLRRTYGRTSSIRPNLSCRPKVIRCHAVDNNPLVERSRRLVFFGGKGGVGKTCTSAAYAVSLAEQGLRTLVLSTDPAHSLGDVLGHKLSGDHCRINEHLWAAEVDPAEALRELREGLQGLDATDFLKRLRIPGGKMVALGLEELSEVLELPPPGVDEIVAIALAAADTNNYDVVVFDTAPTGHTLRMLEVPDFIGGLIDKIQNIRNSVGGVLKMFGLGSLDKFDATFKEADAKVKAIREQFVWFANALRTAPDSGALGASAEFVVVTRPTALDFDETERLVEELQSQGICCRRLIINQIIDANETSAYWETRIGAQEEHLRDLQGICDRRKLRLLKVADSPESLVGIPALTYLASVVFSNEVHLANTEVVLFGGKGGVGKTSMSSALAVQLANEGKRVLLISTDPAHSLGDALDMPICDTPTSVELFTGTGELFAMEVNTAAALQKYQSIVRESLYRHENSEGLVAQVLKQVPIDEFIDLFNTLPPGSDEIVALVEVLEAVQKESYDHIVIDTAPTGHAMRLLTYPDFLERFIDRLARFRDSFDLLPGGDGNDRLRSFQLGMMRIQDLFADPVRTSFAVVTIPTNLALAETKRLFEQLEEQDIRIGMVIMNRIIDTDLAKGALGRRLQNQDKSLEDLENLARRQGLVTTHIHYADREIRGLYGLKYLGRSLSERTP